MGPKKVRIDPDAVYRSSTPVVQQKFPCRRRSVKSNNSAPPKLREQSTLTQLDWSFSTEPSSEIGDDDDDGLERPKRKRRRRTLSDGKRQTTLTQLVGSSFEGATDGAGDEMVVEWDENDMVRDSQSSQVQDQNGRGEEEKDEQHGREDVERQDKRVDSARGKVQSRQSPSPELAVSMHCVRTPRRRFPSEIPSSSTPQSAVLSTQKAHSLRSPDRSPLRSRSANVWPQQEQSGKAPLSPILDTPPKPVSQFRLSPAKSHPTFRIPEKPPSLQHRSTIPDSDDTATQISPPRKRKFPSQIPDTQFHLFGQEVTAETETQYIYTCEPGGETYNSSDFVGYDPACSALDRDAARFMQTQRLQDLRRQQTSTLLFTQEEQEEPPPPKPTQHSPELGAESHPTSKPSAQESEAEAATQSLHLSQPKLPPEEEIEVVDLTESFIPLGNQEMEVIRIASSIVSSSDIPDDKYPSSPPLGPTSPERNLPSSPLPLPLREAIEERLLAPSQISTVAGTQGGWLKRDTQGWLKREMLEVDTSTPPLPPSTSSPPPGAKRVKVMDSEDEGEEEVVFEGGEEDDGDLDLGVSFWGRPEGEDDGGVGRVGDKDDGNEEDEVGELDEEMDEDEEEEGDTTIRDLRDILPDTLLDFSLPPPPPTQSSVRSSWK